MKKWTALVLLLFLTVTALSALADGLPTAQELYERYPVPEVTLDTDPSADPLLTLVNKSHKLPWDFVPELVTLHVSAKKDVNIQMQPEAAQALTDLFDAAKADGMQLVAISAYRSYASQKSIYKRSVEKNGKSYADLASAQAGKSEHQLGLAADVSCDAIKLALTKKFANTKEGKWLYEHCAEYGFIIRYKTEWAKVTGYKGEPWHIRYVGKEHAQFITKLNVPYDTYMAYLQLVWDGMNP